MRCVNCSDRDETVQVRPLTVGRLRVLCAACYLDSRKASTVRQVRVPERERHDRYSQMAARYGVK